MASKLRKDVRGSEGKSVQKESWGAISIDRIKCVDEVAGSTGRLLPQGLEGG